MYNARVGQKVCPTKVAQGSSRPKINELKQKRLAFWLKTTLMQVDIRGFDFVAHQSISLEEAANHLHGEDIDDTPCTLPTKLRKNPNHSDWGHWEFTLTNLNGSPRDIKNATKNIKQIYRDILKLYYVRELLAKLRKVSPIYGEIWLYKDTTGKAMLSMLLNIANEMTETLNESFEPPSIYRTPCLMGIIPVRRSYDEQQQLHKRV